MSLFWVFLLFVFLSPYANDGNNTVDGVKTFIVRVRNGNKPPGFPILEDWYTSIFHNVAPNSKSTDLLYIYKSAFNGFSARLTPQQVELLKNHPGIIDIFPEQTYYLHTTRSPEFMGINRHNPTLDGLMKQSDGGSNVVIGVIDSGIWPERSSFNDEGLDPIPKHWKGECDGGADFPKPMCNRKLVGVRFFSSGLKAIYGENILLATARDEMGHGTHTASTAAGRAVANVSCLGYAEGEASGIATKARIAVYKVCWGSYGCRTSDVLAALDKAIEDQVDIISISMAGEGITQYNYDVIAIGSYKAMEHGIFVSASAGNRGADLATVVNVAPWLTSVGASTIDRTFPVDLVLDNGDIIKGISLYQGKPLPSEKLFPLIDGNGCSKIYDLNRTQIEGKIVLCGESSTDGAVQQGFNVKDSGGIAIVVGNSDSMGEGLVAKPYTLPGMDITFSAREKLINYLKQSQNPRATIRFHPTQLGVTPAPVVGYFSSRGPNPLTPYAMKPDLIAPGVNILAAWSDNVSPSTLLNDPRRVQFNIISGTSMSCPHVSGVAALLKGAHPDWSPAMVRSALMTTAYTLDRNGKPLLDEYDQSIASIWATGAGHVDPERANDPGLVYDLKADDYIDFLCVSSYREDEIRAIAGRSVNCSETTKKAWDMNYPAIVVVSSDGTLDVEVTRVVTHVGKNGSSYTVNVTNPNGVSVAINPPKLEFKEQGVKQSFKIKVSAKQAGSSDVEVGNIVWSDGKHDVKSPLVVVWNLPYDPDEA